MKKSQHQLEPPEFPNDYGSKKDWEEIRELGLKCSMDLPIETAGEVCILSDDSTDSHWKLRTARSLCIINVTFQRKRSSSLMRFL